MGGRRQRARICFRANYNTVLFYRTGTEERDYNIPIVLYLIAYSIVLQPQQGCNGLTILRYANTTFLRVFFPYKAHREKWMLVLSLRVDQSGHHMHERAPMLVLGLPLPHR